MTEQALHDGEIPGRVQGLVGMVVLAHLLLA